MSLHSVAVEALAAEALVRKAEAALALGEMEAALALLDRAELAGAEPDRCAGNRWLALMQRGDLLAAWRESDAIRLRGAPDPHRFWQGEDVRGQRVILRCLHGLGDAVQMFRFLPRLRELAAELIVEVPPSLLEIAPCFSGLGDGVGEVITWGEQAPARPAVWDVQIEIMEVPYLLRVSCEDLEPKQGYLQLPEKLLEKTARAVGNSHRPRVGLVWTAGAWNPARSIPFELLQDLARIEEVQFWSLQGMDERSACPAGPEHPWRDVYEVGDGILPLAATIRHMDLVITVDTLAAHLAGALGVPCWVLLQHRADWRWMSGRADTPWYSTLRLWRQPRPGDWAGLLPAVKTNLSHFAAEAATRRNERRWTGQGTADSLRESR